MVSVRILLLLFLKDSNKNPGAALNFWFSFSLYFLKNGLSNLLLFSPFFQLWYPIFFFFFVSAIGVQAKILFTKEPYSQDALHGRSAILRCEVEQPSDIEFEWLQNGSPFNDTERRFKEGSSLKITSVDRQHDGGNFQCVARNIVTGEEARTTNASFNIKCECLTYKAHLVSQIPL